MAAKLIAHITDMYLGQKLLSGGSVKSGEMGYESDPDEHKDNLQLILGELRKRGG
jgi:hypothetical protein